MQTTPAVDTILVTGSLSCIRSCSRLGSRTLSSERVYSPNRRLRGLESTYRSHRSLFGAVCARFLAAWFFGCGGVMPPHLVHATSDLPLRILRWHVACKPSYSHGCLMALTFHNYYRRGSSQPFVMNVMPSSANLWLNGPANLLHSSRRPDSSVSFRETPCHSDDYVHRSRGIYPDTVLAIWTSFVRSLSSSF